MKRTWFFGALCLGFVVLASGLYRREKAEDIEAEIEALVHALKDNDDIINEENERSLGDFDPDDLTDEELLALAGLDLGGDDDDDDEDDDDEGDDDGGDETRREILYEALKKRLTPVPGQWPPKRWPPWGWPPRPWWFKKLNKVGGIKGVATGRK